MKISNGNEIIQHLTGGLKTLFQYFSLEVVRIANVIKTNNPAYTPTMQQMQFIQLTFNV